MGEKSKLTEEDWDTDIDFSEKNKRVKSSGGKRVRKLPHNPEVYYVWFLANQILHKYEHLPQQIVKDWKLEKYPLPEDWNERSDVLEICKKFVDKEAYRLFGEQIGKSMSVIIDKKFLKFEPQEEILLKIPLNNSKTFSQRMEEIKKLLKKVHKFTEDYKAEYPQLEGCDWNLKKKRKTSMYKTTMTKPRAAYFWELILFLKHYLEEGYEPQDMKRNMRQYRIIRPYLSKHTTQYWNNSFDNHLGDRSKLKSAWSEFEINFMVRFRNDTISLYKALKKGTFPR